MATIFENRLFSITVLATVQENILFNREDAFEENFLVNRSILKVTEDDGRSRFKELKEFVDGISLMLHHVVSLC